MVVHGSSCYGWLCSICDPGLLPHRGCRMDHHGPPWTAVISRSFPSLPIGLPRPPSPSLSNPELLPFPSESKGRSLGSVHPIEGRDTTRSAAQRKARAATCCAPRACACARAENLAKAQHLPCVWKGRGRRNEWNGARGATWELWKDREKRLAADTKPVPQPLPQLVSRETGAGVAKPQLPTDWSEFREERVLL